MAVQFHLSNIQGINMIKSKFSLLVFSCVLGTSMLLGSQAHANFRKYEFRGSYSCSQVSTSTGVGFNCPVISDNAVPAWTQIVEYLYLYIPTGNRSVISGKACKTDAYGNGLVCTSSSISASGTGYNYLTIPGFNQLGFSSAADSYYIQYSFNTSDTNVYGPVKIFGVYMGDGT